MVAVLLGLAVATSYGAGDFFGGLAARRLAATAVTVGSQATALLVLCVVVWLVPASPTRGDLLRGGVAGVVGMVAVSLLYRGLGSGRMSVVAPITAVGAAVVPFAYGVATGDDVTTLDLVGVAAALVGIVLVASAPGPEVADERGAAGRARLSEVGPAVLSGIGFGAVFVLLGRASADAGLFPVFTQRIASVGVLGPFLLVTQRSGFLATYRAGGRYAPNLRLLVPTGLLDGGANALFVLATRSRSLAIVSVLSSIYPASTVLLARVVLKERLVRNQLFGLAAVAVGVVLLAF